MDRFDEMRGKTTFSAGGEGGGAVIIPPEAGDLVSIMFESLPVKVDYNEGDTIDIKGMKVMAKFENDVYVDVTSGCSIAVEDPLTVYTSTVFVKYEDFSLSYNIRVYGRPAEIPSGTKILAHFDNNIINSINETSLSSSSSVGYTTGMFGSALSKALLIDSINTTHGVPKPGTMATGTATIEFWLYRTGNSYSDSPLISFGTLSSSNGIFIYVNSSKVGVLVGGTVQTKAEFNLSNSGNVWRHYAFTFNNGEYSIFVDGKKLGSVTAKTVGGVWGTDEMTVYANYGYIDEFLISDEVNYFTSFFPATSAYGGAKVLKKLYVEETPNKTVYEAGEYFDLSGAKIVAVFSNGAITDVTGECIVENNNPITTTDEFRILSYEYDGVTKQVYINVGAYTLQSNPSLSTAKLLMNFDGNTEDLTGLNTPEVLGDNFYGSMAESKFGQSKYFNGSTDGIRIQHNQNFDTGDFTIAVWFKTLSFAKAQVIFIMNEMSSSDTTMFGLRTGINPDGTVFGVFTDATKTSTNIFPNNTTKITLGQWTHFAITKKGNTYTGYKDGVKLGSVTTDLVVNFEDVIMLGVRKWKGSLENYFNGYMDDFIVAKSALWEDEFTPPSTPLSGTS